jgi:cytochrome c551
VLLVTEMMLVKTRAHLKKVLENQKLKIAMEIMLVKTQAASTESTGETTTANAGDAEKMYEQKCSACHGGGREGIVGPPLSAIGAKLSKDDIKSIILNGKQGGMPAGLASDDIASKIAEWLANKK